MAVTQPRLGPDSDGEGDEYSDQNRLLIVFSSSQHIRKAFLAKAMQLQVLDCC